MAGSKRIHARFERIMPGEIVERVKRRTVSNATKARLLRTVAPDAPTIVLGILERRSLMLDPSLPPMLLLHGATLGARLFDLPRPGYSLMAALACTGRAVYALDIRGFGTSLGSIAMEEPPLQNPPFAGVDAAVTDVAAAADFILARQGVRALDLIGFSWGAVLAARFAADNPGKVARLALYAPLYGAIDAPWLDHIIGAERETLGAYRLVTLDGLVRRWNAGLPTADALAYREELIPELVFETLARLDPQSSSQRPPAFRCPNGPLADIARICSGQPLYDPAKLTMPILLVRGDDDTTSTHAGTVGLLAATSSPERRYCVVAPGSHFLCIERNRAALYEHLNDFFLPTRPRAAQSVKYR